MIWIQEKKYVEKLLDSDGFQIFPYVLTFLCQITLFL